MGLTLAKSGTNSGKEWDYFLATIGTNFWPSMGLTFGKSVVLTKKKLICNWISSKARNQNDGAIASEVLGFGA